MTVLHQHVAQANAVLVIRGSCGCDSSSARQSAAFAQLNRKLAASQLYVLTLTSSLKTWTNCQDFSMSRWISLVVLPH